MIVLYIYSAVRKPTGAPFLVVSDGGAPAAPPLKRTSIGGGRSGEPRYTDFCWYPASLATPGL